MTNQRLVQAFARLVPVAFGLSSGIVAAAILFGLTAVVVINGPMVEGEEVGHHLGLLAHYLPGYTVSWVGAFLGLIWGLVVGFVLGFLLAGFMNFHHGFYLRMVERGIQRQGLLDG